jgi:hypothetical protein
MSGPSPKREDQRIRRNTPDVPVDKISVIGQVTIPELNIDNPHPLVVDLYESLKTSAQNKFYEDSDWATARLAMYALNQELTNDTFLSGDSKGLKRSMSAVKLQVINQMFASLMMTEGERRRARLEIERDQTGASGEVVQISDLFKQRLGAN